MGQNNNVLKVLQFANLPHGCMCKKCIISLSVKHIFTRAGAYGTGGREVLYLSVFNRLMATRLKP